MINNNHTAPELKGSIVKLISIYLKKKMYTHTLTILMSSIKAEHQSSLVLFFGYYSCGIFF